MLMMITLNEHEQQQNRQVIIQKNRTELSNLLTLKEEKECGMREANQLHSQISSLLESLRLEDLNFRQKMSNNEMTALQARLDELKAMKVVIDPVSSTPARNRLVSRTK